MYGRVYVRVLCEQGKGVGVDAEFLCGVAGHQASLAWTLVTEANKYKDPFGQTQQNLLLKVWLVGLQHLWWIALRTCGFPITGATFKEQLQSIRDSTSQNAQEKRKLALFGIFFSDQCPAINVVHDALRTKQQQPQQPEDPLLRTFVRTSDHPRSLQHSCTHTRHPHLHL